MPRLMSRIAAALAIILAPEPATLGFAIRTTVAALMALFIAYALQLESPHWAATTVFIVAQPVRGMVIAKSFYRVLGTLIGAAVAVLLIALCGQAPELFIAGIAVWVAACTYVYTILRYFRAYAAVLSGYTAALVGLAAATDPSAVFDIAVQRSSAVILGIACTALLTGLLAPGSAKQNLIDRLNQAASDAARWLALIIEGGGGAEAEATQHRLIMDIMRFEELAGYAAAESPEFRGRLDELRGIAAALLAMLSAGHAIAAHVRRRPDEANAARVSLRPVLEPATARLTQPQAIADALPLLRQSLAAASAATVSERLILDRLDDALAALATALDGIAALAMGRPASAPETGRGLHRDWTAAKVNALRAALGIAVAGIFWIVTAWPSGATMLIIVAVTVSLFATRDNPAEAASDFFVGTILGAVFAFAMCFFVLPRLDGFPLLAGALAPVMIVGSLLAADPSTAGLGASFNVYFLTLIAPTNPMVYDVVSFLNSTLATIVGMAIGIAVFILVLPPDRAERLRRLLLEIAQDLRRLAASPRLPAQAAWESRMYERVALLLPAADEELRDSGLAALGIGLEIMRLRSLLAKGTLPSSAVRHLRLTLARLARDPALAVAVAREAAEHLAALDGKAPLAVQRARAALEEIADTLTEHPALFAVME
jgi:uncharacterized membrane protein YccC